MISGWRRLPHGPDKSGCRNLESHRLPSAPQSLPLVMIGEESAPSRHSRGRAPFHTLTLPLRSLGRAQGAGLEADTLLKDQNEVLKAPGPEIGVWAPSPGIREGQQGRWMGNRRWEDMQGLSEAAQGIISEDPR